MLHQVHFKCFDLWDVSVFSNICGSRVLFLFCKINACIAFSSLKTVILRVSCAISNINNELTEIDTWYLCWSMLWLHSVFWKIKKRMFTWVSSLRFIINGFCCRHRYRYNVTSSLGDSYFLSLLCITPFYLRRFSTKRDFKNISRIWRFKMLYQNLTNQ